MPLRIVISAILAFATLAATAQRRGGSRYATREYYATASAVNDTIKTIAGNYSAHLDSLASAIRFGTSITTTTADGQLTNPYYYPLFAGNTLLALPLRNTIGSLQPVSQLNIVNGAFVPSSLGEISAILANHYASHPASIYYTLALPEHIVTEEVVTAEDETARMPHTAATRREASYAANAPVEMEKRKMDVVDELDLSDFHIHIMRPDFWTIKGNFSTQFMQYYVSDNWYKGGENHVSMLGIFNIEANYDNKQRLTFTNKLETKLGFQTSPSDTYHKFKTNADLLRLTDKLGVQAHKHWYYTIMLQTSTQFYKAYKSNTQEVSSDFMSPFESVLSVGLDYKLSRKRINLSANFAPGAADFKYCDRSAIATNHGIPEGKHFKVDLGSTLTVNMTWKICEQINWVSRLYAFYDYHKHLKAEWENTINLKINKYLSTKLFLYPRYDNNVKAPSDDASYFQFNEYLSVGLDLNF